MTLEEVTALANTLKGQVETMLATGKAQSDKIAAQEAELARLREHSARLLKEKKKIKNKARPQDDDADDDDTDDTPDDTPDDKDLSRVATRYQKQIDELKKQLDAERAARDKAAIDAALAEALDKAGIAPQYRAAAKALLATTGKLTVADGAAQFDGRPVVDSVTEWAKSDEGRAFVAAPVNGGGAAIPAPSGRTSQIPAPASKSRSEMTRAEKGAFIREHGAEAYHALPA